MKKLLLSSVILIFFSFSIIMFQLSCKKEAGAQQTNNCSETAKVVFTINFPSSSTLGSIGLENENILPTPEYRISYWKDFSDLNSSPIKTFTINNVIPGKFVYQAQSTLSTLNIPVTIVAGQTYNITINSSDFH